MSDYDELCALIQNGAAVSDAARVLGRTLASTYDLLYQHGATVRSLRDTTIAVRTLHEVTHLFGVTWHIARRWVDMRWLAARRNGTRKRRGSKKPAHFLVTDVALMDFIAVREAWPTYDPAAIRDTHWRAAAEEERAAAGGHWIRATAWLKARHYHEKYAWHLIQTGRLEATKISNVWYVWEAR